MDSLYLIFFLLVHSCHINNIVNSCLLCHCLLDCLGPLLVHYNAPHFCEDVFHAACELEPIQLVVFSLFFLCFHVFNRISNYGNWHIEFSILPKARFMLIFVTEK